MGESPCSLDGGVDCSNHLFPRQTDEVRTPPVYGGKSVGSHWDWRWRTAGSALQATGLSAWRHQDLSHRQNHGHTVSQGQSVLKYWSNRTTCDGRYTAVAVAPVCRFESLTETICGSVVVQRDRVGTYMAILRVIHSFQGR